MNCLTCGLDKSRKFGEIEFDESSVVQLLPRGMGIAAPCRGASAVLSTFPHVHFGTAKKKRRNRVVNAQTQPPRRSWNYTSRSRDTIKPFPSPESALIRFHCTCHGTDAAMRFLRKTRTRFRVIEMRAPRALQCWPRICDRIRRQRADWLMTTVALLNRESEYEQSGKPTGPCVMVL